MLTVVVPTHNRRDRLLQVLDALSRQSGNSGPFEVVVVADTCNDGTLDMARQMSARVSYPLHIVAHVARNAAASRNIGAEYASGDRLLFLDDDVVPTPGLVAAHAAESDPRVAVLGYSQPILPDRPSWWHYGARMGWENHYREISRPGARFHYRHFFSGNVSVGRELFDRVGGFDAELRRLEDHELGLRLLRAGARFKYVPAAHGLHHETASTETWLRRVREEGRADVRIGTLHPELRHELFGGRFARSLGHDRRPFGKHFERILLQVAGCCEWARARGTWKRVLEALREYNYWLGVVEALGHRDALAGWLQDGPVAGNVTAQAPEIDMAALPSGTRLRILLERGTRCGIRLSIDDVEVLILPPRPGAEPLRLGHLLRAVRDLSRNEFVPALALHFVRGGEEGLASC